MFTDAMFNQLLLDLEYIRLCWIQLNISITPKLHMIFTRLPYLLQLFNGGFDKLEESRIESSHQSRTRDYHRLSRMDDKGKAEKYFFARPFFKNASQRKAVEAAPRQQMLK